MWGGLALLMLLVAAAARGERHSVAWGSGNPRLRSEGYMVTVNVNDYLDIYCPHLDSPQAHHRPESYVLYMVNYQGYLSCNHSLGTKRWECRPSRSPHNPVRFSEKFQRFSAFSLGYEFAVGQEYYYMSTPTHHHGRKCLRMKVFVCCATSPRPSETLDPTPPPLTVGHGVKSVKDLVTDDFTQELPKLERSVSGSTPTPSQLRLTIVLSLLLLRTLVTS
ncbi:ephrin-A3-like [Narcine bancroftii]|uniref:ephrin-A3-like n=1 Tax=Narcine bancroftii TaxID=1343680 RepID=UPI003831FE51